MASLSLPRQASTACRQRLYRYYQTQLICRVPHRGRRHRATRRARRTFPPRPTRARAGRRFGYGSTTADVRGAGGVHPACPLIQPFNASRLVPYSPSFAWPASIAPRRDQRREYDLVNRVVKTKTVAKPPPGVNHPPQRPTRRYRPHRFRNVASNCARIARCSHICPVVRAFDGYKNRWAFGEGCRALSAGSKRIGSARPGITSGNITSFGTGHGRP